MKKYIGMFAVLLTVVLSVSCEYITDLDFESGLNEGLMVYWPVVDSDTTYLKDFSGNGNNITNHNNTSAVSIIEGKYSNAFRTNGISSAFSYCESSSPQIIPSTNELTFMAWVRIWATNGTIINLSSGGSGYFYIIFYSNVFDVYCNGIIINNISHTPTDWLHIAAVRNNEGLFFYINGSCVSQKTGSASSFTTTRVTIGANLTTNPYFNGALDEIRIYNRALSEAEIKKLMTIGMK